MIDAMALPKLVGLFFFIRLANNAIDLFVTLVPLLVFTGQQKNLLTVNKVHAIIKTVPNRDKVLLQLHKESVSNETCRTSRKVP